MPQLIVFILILVLSLLSARKKPQQNGGGAAQKGPGKPNARAAGPAGRKPAQRAASPRPAPAPAQPAVTPAQPLVTPAQPAVTAVSEAGGIQAPGSLIPEDYVSTEGESEEEHQEHLKRADSRPPEETALRRPRFDPQEMRRAVVMSEILGRPKALRRGRP